MVFLQLFIPFLVQSTSNNTIVTLGIGHDIRAEEKLLEVSRGLV